MSIRLMSWVWEHSPEKDEGLLVHLALADFANDFGDCFPSLETLAAKARITVRGTQRILRRLEQRKVVETTRSGGPNGVNLYRLIMGDPQSPRPTVTPTLATPGGDPGDTRGVTLEDRQSHPDPSLTVIVIEPSIEPSTRVLQPFQELRGFSEATPKQLTTLIEKISSKYASVDLEEEAIKMASWLESSKGKGRKCSPGFILAWLGRDAKERRNGQRPSRDANRYANWPDGRAR